MRAYIKVFCYGKFHDSTQIMVKLFVVRLNFSVEFSVGLAWDFLIFKTKTIITPTDGISLVRLLQYFKC